MNLMGRTMVSNDGSSTIKPSPSNVGLILGLSQQGGVDVQKNPPFHKRRLPCAIVNQGGGITIREKQNPGLRSYGKKTGFRRTKLPVRIPSLLATTASPRSRPVENALPGVGDPFVVRGGSDAYSIANWLGPQTKGFSRVGHHYRCRWAGKRRLPQEKTECAGLRAGNKIGQSPAPPWVTPIRRCKKSALSAALILSANVAVCFFGEMLGACDPRARESIRTHAGCRALNGGALCNTQSNGLFGTHNISRQNSRAPDSTRRQGQTR